MEYDDVPLDHSHDEAFKIFYDKAEQYLNLPDRIKATGYDIRSRPSDVMSFSSAPDILQEGFGTQACYISGVPLVTNFSWIFPESSHAYELQVKGYVIGAYCNAKQMWDASLKSHNVDPSLIATFLLDEGTVEGGKWVSPLTNPKYATLMEVINQGLGAHKGWVDTVFNKTKVDYTGLTGAVIKGAESGALDEQLKVAYPLYDSPFSPGWAPYELHLGSVTDICDLQQKHLFGDQTPDAPL